MSTKKNSGASKLRLSRETILSMTVRTNVKTGFARVLPVGSDDSCFCRGRSCDAKSQLLNPFC